MNTCTVFPVTGLGTTCKFPLEVARRLYLMPLLKSDGSANEFATVADVTKANIITAIEAGEMFPLPLIDSVEDVQGDPTLYEYGSGSKEFIKDGVRDFKGVIPSLYSNTNLLKRLGQITGQEFGLVYIDKKGNLVYKSDDGVKVQPITVEGASWYARLMKPTYSEPLMIEIAFNFSQDEDDGDLSLIQKDDLDFNGLSMTEIYGLAPLYIEYQSTTTGDIQIKLTTAYGVPVQGFVLADFSVVTSGGEELDGIIEDPIVLGRYVLQPALEFTAGAAILEIQKAKWQKLSESITLTA